MASASSNDPMLRTPPAPMTTNRRRLKLLMSYAPDWVITLGATGAFYLLDQVQGFRRNFSLNDTSIQYPYTRHERVPMWLLLVVSGACPLVIMPCINLLTIRSWWDWHNSWLGLVLALGLTGTLTNIIKVLSGRPRPDMLARCLPQHGSANAPVYGLVDSSICTQTDVNIMKDAFRSFISGHSSLSAAGLGFLFFYLSGKLHLFDQRGHTIKAWVAGVPLTGLILIPITRTMDYRHHPIDALVGSLVGLSIAYFSYRQYYPSLESPLSHRPYSPRIPHPDNGVANVKLTTPSGALNATNTARGSNPMSQELGEEGTVPRENLELHDIYSAADDTPSPRQDRGRV